jgi:hypothetical protein
MIGLKMLMRSTGGADASLLLPFLLHSLLHSFLSLVLGFFLALEE